jgi:flagellar assembly protein FliH
MNSTSAAPSKFTFDLDLGVADARSRVLTETRIAEIKKDAHDEGYAKGLVDGEQSAVANAAHQLTASAEQLGQHLSRLTAESMAARKTHQAEATELAAIIGRKLAGHLTERLPAVELNRLIAECLVSLEDAPHLVIRCNPQLCDAIKETAEAQMVTSGFSGKLIVMGEPDIALGDGRIEWVDGGVVRDSQTLFAQIDTSITQFLDAQGIARSAQPPANGEETDQ